MLIRVFEIPAPDGKFCFGGGIPKMFKEVDWFRDDEPPHGDPLMPTEEGRKTIKDFIMKKNYFNPDKAYLVLHQEHTFTIGYEAA